MGITGGSSDLETWKNRQKRQSEEKTDAHLSACGTVLSWQMIEGTEQVKPNNDARLRRRCRYSSGDGQREACAAGSVSAALEIGDEHAGGAANQTGRGGGHEVGMESRGGRRRAREGRDRQWQGAVLHAPRARPRLIKDLFTGQRCPWLRMPQDDLPETKARACRRRYAAGERMM
ncbi:hypothetical protein HYPSUDRAFT_783765, partial [Hypholoma sublateritium FD-334 SS-4]